VDGHVFIVSLDPAITAVLAYSMCESWHFPGRGRFPAQKLPQLGIARELAPVL
jgi:hypothetical protein